MIYPYDFHRCSSKLAHQWHSSPAYYFLGGFEMKKLMGILVVAVLMAGISGVVTPVQAAGKQAGATSVSKLNINKASAAELTALNGIGQKKAEAIVAFRTEHGNFKKAEDLMLVKGIGPKVFEKIKSQISVQ